MSEIKPTTVTQGGTYGNDEVGLGAANAVDKNLKTLSASHTDNGRGWLKLQFDEVHFVHKVVVYYRFYTHDYNDNSEGCMVSVDIFRSCVNGDNNVEVSVYQGEVKQKSCGTLQLTYGLEQSDQIYTLLCNTKGDTVKLSKSTGVIAVSEVVVTSTGKLTR